MSSIDLSNPQVLKNWLIAQMKEGKGEFLYKEKVLVFRSPDGSEYVAPKEVLAEVQVVDKTSGDILIDEKEESAEATPKKKKQIKV